MTLICGGCDKHFNRNEDATLHMQDVHRSSPSPTHTPNPSPGSITLNHSCKEQAFIEVEELILVIENLTQGVYDPTSEDKTREEVKNQLNRFKRINNKKIYKQRETTLKVKKLVKEVERLTDEYELSSEVATKQYRELKYQDKQKEKIIKEITELKADIKQKTQQIVESDSDNEVQEIPKNVVLNRDATENKCITCNKKR